MHFPYARNKNDFFDMKIFQLFVDPYLPSVNPYVATLMDGVKTIDQSVEFGFGLEKFWEDVIFDYNILHIHWPDFLLSVRSTHADVLQVECRLREIRHHGIKIIVTCHNLKAHYAKNPSFDEAYDVAYSSADVILHMGSYSKNLFEKQYPQAKHIILPHHTYDTLYRLVDRNESLKKLNLDPAKRYILCFGAFRDKEERVIADEIVGHYRSRGYELLAPGYIRLVKRRNFIIQALQWIRWKYICIMKKYMHVYGRFVSNEMLPYFFCAADISIIQRRRILNSGNLPLGFLMENVVVGPDVGNVGQLLKDSGNPTFNPNDITTLFDAIDKAFTLKDLGKGLDNRDYAKKHFTTEIVSKQLLNIYKSCVE